MIQENFLLQIQEFAKSYNGRTPVYVYSKKIFVENYQKLYSAFATSLSHDFLIAYSIKSNANEFLVRSIVEQGSGVDCVSAGEILLALKCGCDPKKIVFAGVGKQDFEIELAINTGILQINAESKEEIEIINQISLRLGKKCPVSIRVNPHIDENANYTHDKITTGKRGIKFGIDIDDIPDLSQFKNIDFVGFSCHIGSQITDIAFFEKSFVRLKELILKYKIKTLDLGGGIGVKYQHGQDVILISEYAKLVQDVFCDISSDIKIIFEPGRIISASSGVLLSKVLYVKETKHKKFLILDSGFNDLIRPAMYDSYHEIIPCFEGTNEMETYDIVGPVCESSDIFAKDRKMGKCKRGEFVLLLTAGAYGRVLSSCYNQRDLPFEVIL